MKFDGRILLLAGVAVVAAGWAVTYAGAVQQLVTTGTNGYVTLVRGLEPPAIASAYGGAGNFAANTGLMSGQPYSTSPLAQG